VISAVGTVGSITGNIAVCNGVSELYSISAVNGASSYTWTLPAGWNINNGQGLIQVDVTAGAGAQNGNISVVAENVCYTSAPGILAVTVQQTPAIPSQ